MFRRVAVITLSILLALALTILPLPNFAIWLRPLWVPMVLCAWLMVVPETISIGSAFMIGLFMDILLGTLLGEHALVLCILAYFTTKFQRRILLFPLWQKTAFTFLLLLVYQSVRCSIQGFSGQLPATWKYWLPLITSTLLWPWIYFLLRDYSRRLKLK